MFGYVWIHLGLVQWSNKHDLQNGSLTFWDQSDPTDTPAMAGTEAELGQGGQAQQKMGSEGINQGIFCCFVTYHIKMIYSIYYCLLQFFKDRFCSHLFGMKTKGGF